MTTPMHEHVRKIIQNCLDKEINGDKDDLLKSLLGQPEEGDEKETKSEEGSEDSYDPDDLSFGDEHETEMEPEEHAMIILSPEEDDEEETKKKKK
jgi:hypothetical protein